MIWLQFLIVFLLKFDLNMSAETWWSRCGSYIFSRRSNRECLKTAINNIKHIPGMMVTGGQNQRIVFYCGLKYQLVGRSYLECNASTNRLIESDAHPTCVPLLQNYTNLNSTADSPVPSAAYFQQCIIAVVIIIVLIITLIVVILSFSYYIRRLKRELRMEQTFHTANARPDTEVCLPIVPPRPPETFLELVSDQNDYGYLEPKSSVTPSTRIESVQYDEVRISSVQYDDAHGESHLNRDKNVDDEHH